MRITDRQKAPPVQHVSSFLVRFYLSFQYDEIEAHALSFSVLKKSSRLYSQSSLDSFLLSKVKEQGIVHNQNKTRNQEPEPAPRKSDSLTSDVQNMLASGMLDAGHAGMTHRANHESRRITDDHACTAWLCLHIMTMTCDM